ncbi:putative BsuMI modification methylase subunit YdiO [Deinococcus carri]|uniref:DNA (cytosine-5-)-methyltransferase n=1 Tax=Deinococcus carri TaxID=1211323 RepID=A0ABP9WC56_9DEIO
MGQTQKTSKNEIVGVDLFSGAGGLTHGMYLQGINVVAGIDIDPSCRYPYETNNPARFIQKSVEDVTVQELADFYKNAQIRLLAGCAPCQPFSTYSQRGRAQRGGEDWKLVLDFGRLVRDTQPELVTMENVPQLLQHNVFQEFLDFLEGYQLWYGVVDCVEYGLPQTRRRLVLLASKLGSIRILTPEEFGRARRVVREAIVDLPPLEAGGQHPDDPLHISSRLSELNLRRIRQARPGKTWRDWEDQSLVAACHRKATGETYPSVYGRMEWEQPSPTITTQCFGFGNGRFGHPEQDRAISLREAAILQSFPRNYQFVAPGQKVNLVKVGRMIGNAVPVMIGELVGKSLRHHVNGIQRVDASSA